MRPLATVSLVAFNASEIGDPDGTRTVIAIIALLVVMGVALVMLAFWMRRVTRPDPEYLAPLEMMGERSWRKGDPLWQRRMLDEVRPNAAVPLTRTSAPPRFDRTFDAGPSGTGFDDLRDEQGAAATAERTDGNGGPVEVVGPKTPPETAAIETDPTQPTRGSEWPPQPSVAAFGVNLLDESDQPAADDAARDDGDGVNHAEAADDDSTPTATALHGGFADFAERAIDPAELERAMAELDSELQRRKGAE